MIIRNYLRELFNKIHGTRIFQFNREFYHVKQDGLSIADYFDKIKMIWDDDSLCEYWS